VVVKPLNRDWSGVRHRRRTRVLLGSLGFVALAVPLAQAGAAAAATLADNPNKTASVNGRVHDVVYNGNVLYLVGDFTTATDSGATVARNHAAAIDVSTGHLLPWNPNANGEVDSVAFDPAAGAVYLGGAFGKVGGVATKHLARVAATGTGAASTTWKHSADLTVYSVAVGNGRLYAAGAFTTIDTSARAGLAAFSLSSGALDTGWAPQALGGKMRDVVATPTRVYVAGEAATLDGSAQFGKLGAVNPTTGALDQTFKVHVPYRVFNIAVTANAVYAAADGNGGHLWSLTLAGKQNWVITADGGYQAVTVVGDLVVGGGHFDNVCKTSSTGAQGSCQQGQTTRHKLMAVDAGGQLQDWAPNADSPLGVFALQTNAAGSQIAVGGDFTGFHSLSVKQAHLAVFGFA
jgi:hypothetical protein